MTISITLTGVDERTKVHEIVQLAEAGAEIGILYTHSPDGRNRYPSLQWIVDVLFALDGRRVAIHVCGMRARQALSIFLTDKVDRVQINGTVNSALVHDLCYYVGESIITQHTPENAGLLTLDVPNHFVLVDKSGGRGITPAEWVRPETTKPVGFAGGLSLETLPRELSRIAAVARGDWWIDMESGLRDENDWFDVNKAKRVLDLWDKWRADNAH